jgi:hypothetical protein
VAAERVTWHGKTLPMTGEIVRLGVVETVVEVPFVPNPSLKRKCV